MTRPRLLDLFCCEGGAGEGYRRIGFDVVGVDIDARALANNPNPSVLADAIQYAAEYGHKFDAIHASPPCQRWSTATADPEAHPDLIDLTRAVLIEADVPFVIENVPSAPLRRDLLLCGSMFDMQVRRHRIFELGGFTVPQPPCRHAEQKERGPIIGVVGTGGDSNRPRKPGTGGAHRKPRNLEHARELMGMPWASRRGCTEAIPPAYTEFIGSFLWEEINA